MSNPLPIVVLASLVAGGAGAVATTVFTGKTSAAQATTQDVTAGSEDLLAAIRSIESGQRDLADRIGELEASSEMAPIGMAAPRVAATAAGETDIEEAVKSVLAGMDAKEVTAATPRLEKAVEAVIELRDERRRQEREAERAEADAKRLEDRLARLQTELGLDQGQMNSMRTLYQDRDVRRDEAREEMRAIREAGGGREEMRAMWTGLTEEFNAEVEKVLTPGQFETFQESDNNNDRGGRGGRGGDNGGGAAGGGRGGGRGGR